MENETKENRHSSKNKVVLLELFIVLPQPIFIGVLIV